MMQNQGHMHMTRPGVLSEEKVYINSVYANLYLQNMSSGAAWFIKIGEDSFEFWSHDSTKPCNLIVTVKYAKLL